MLVRLDPSKKATALMSFPRDLKVEIPGVGTDKINAAFSFGGPKLTVKTVKKLTGLRINHVDKRRLPRLPQGGRPHRLRLHRRRPALLQREPRRTPRSTSKPGYRKLCGYEALEYVRFRHEDNDLVRGGAPAGLPAPGEGPGLGAAS